MRKNMLGEISRNNIMSNILVLFFVILVSVTGYLMGYFWGSPTIGLIIAGSVAILYAIIGYFSGSSMVLGSVNAKEVTRDSTSLSHKQYYNIVEELSIASGTPMPRVWIMPSRALNAFATGRNPKNGHVAITEGLLEKLNREELKGVMAHELAHIKNYDIRLLLLTAVLIGTLLALSDIFIRSLIFGGGGRDRGGGNAIILVIGILFAILAPVLAYMVKFAISRQREYLADATAAYMTRYPEGLASALEKIKHDTYELKGASALNSEMFIKNPLKKNWFHNMFSTHPPIDERIRRLRSM